MTKIQEYNLAKSNPSLAIFQAIQDMKRMASQFVLEAVDREKKMIQLFDEFQEIKEVLKVIPGNPSFPAFPDIPKTDLTETNKLLSHLIELSEKNKEPEKISINLKIE